MKIDIDDLGETYKKCMSTGKFKERIVDIERIKSLKSLSESSLEFIKPIIKTTPKASPNWTFVFREHYETLRGLIEAYILFDGIEADNHQCTNAYACLTYKTLELDWKFFETARLKRNAINYNGKTLSYDDWNVFAIQFELYIKLLHDNIEKKLNEAENSNQ